MKYLISLLFLIGLIVGTQATASGTDIQKAESYLNSIGRMQANFTQTYWDEQNNEQVLTGTFYLDRPGKMRFEFNEIDDFIVADGFFVYFYDSEERQQSNAPIGQTLADFILRNNIKLRDDISVGNLRKSNGHTIMTLTQTADPQAGTLELMFSDIPFQLVKWRVTDSQGTTVDVAFNNIKTNVTFQNGLFSYRDPNAPIGQLNE